MVDIQINNELQSLQKTKIHVARWKLQQILTKKNNLKIAAAHLKFPNLASV